MKVKPRVLQLSAYIHKGKWWGQFLYVLGDHPARYHTAQGYDTRDMALGAANGLADSLERREVEVSDDKLSRP